MNTHNETLKSIQYFSKLLNQELITILSPITKPENILHKAMCYTILNPGKYIRPFLVNASAKIFNVDIKRILPVSAIIEIIHIYSLIHDDLPSMDNASTRRGKKSCHKKFGEHVAILTGDALLTLAFELISDLRESNYIKCKMIKAVSQACGYQGMINGQLLDIVSPITDLCTIQKMHELKTSKMFSAACELGAILGKASKKETDYLINYGRTLGCAFQIKDDIKDIHQDHQLNNIVNIIGIEESENYMNDLFNQSIEYLKPFTHKANLLSNLVKFIQKI
ncbi:polyprenyl synthetase family protein [Neoehrlichia mikurensis]|uniref:Polyprenyl synthetase family protein n=1 Tax=Neoehrlichia mikurensis TaxID=89586 RepID=A0A9Q9BZI7_9RICK|nr:polyprenyl synthetase family protein [Neoehrlichia mikurensis]QXK91831.1 polyprenyl synthetase family protein [Neoehrlichia mikurensis]QXK93043.1 polyprenyl synthetase family protein [Neoehrlichia mikurensis]QXK93521.1 polyprenyl synthetase family protein [Neoehrlichia mikurensis]UTO55524.1 polyprenyl synthetase family protein [Neoehrlichia mikurensis]UTO56445.1 polyprenyl synthetase family protein [Neoehrlichia mikurensis]